MNVERAARRIGRLAGAPRPVAHAGSLATPTLVAVAKRVACQFQVVLPPGPCPACAGSYGFRSWQSARTACGAAGASHAARILGSREGTGRPAQRQLSARPHPGRRAHRLASGRRSPGPAHTGGHRARQKKPVRRLAFDSNHTLAISQLVIRKRGGYQLARQFGFDQRSRRQSC